MMIYHWHISFAFLFYIITIQSKNQAILAIMMYFIKTPVSENI